MHKIYRRSKAIKNLFRSIRDRFGMSLAFMSLSKRGNIFMTVFGKKKIKKYPKIFYYQRK